jgi:hypothetical protein
MRVTLHFLRSPTKCLLLPLLGHIGQNVSDPVINAGRASWDVKQMAEPVNDAARPSWIVLLINLHRKGPEIRLFPS